MKNNSIRSSSSVHKMSVTQSSTKMLLNIAHIHEASIGCTHHMHHPSQLRSQSQDPLMHCTQLCQLEDTLCAKEGQQTLGCRSCPHRWLLTIFAHWFPPPPPHWPRRPTAEWLRAGGQATADRTAHCGRAARIQRPRKGQ